MANTQLTPPAMPPLAEIAAAQAERRIWAFDRMSAADELARLQRLYARRRAESDLLSALFDEGTPDLSLHGDLHTLRLRGELVADVYAVLRDNLDKALLRLEASIVQAHQAVIRQAQDAIRDHADRTDYVPHILALCQPGAHNLAA